MSKVHDPFVFDEKHLHTQFQRVENEPINPLRTQWADRIGKTVEAFMNISIMVHFLFSFFTGHFPCRYNFRGEITTSSKVYRRYWKQEE